MRESIKHFHSAHETSSKASLPFRPVQAHKVVVAPSLSPDASESYRSVAFQALRLGQIAAVIMSGGQGTRLGYHGPKGIYDINLPSHKSIFQLHIERIRKIRSLTLAWAQRSSNNNNSSNEKISIPIYVMTSDLNHQQIQEYFAENNYFDYPAEDIVFFEQGLEPCFDLSGKILLDSTESLSLAPDGNGGLYKALQHSGSLADMNRRGVQHLHIYGIDNVMTKSLDPLFLGICLAQDVECGNKVVWRASKAEKVGVTADLAGKMHILEYSEIPASLAETEDDEGKLLFGAANICNHYVQVAFLQNTVLPSLSSTYHIAKKKIPYYDPVSQKTVVPTFVNGVKLEMFIFDVFPLATRWTVVEVLREDEFAPVKNEPGNIADSPDTARQLISQQAVRWLKAAGAVLDNKDSSADGQLYEISPLLSYEGEGLLHLHGQRVQPGYFTA